MTPQKVFLSYSSADEPFVRVLHGRLSRDGIDCYFAPSSMPVGAHVVMALQEAIDECNHLVMVVSEAYLASEFANAEWAAVLTGDPLNSDRRLVPLLRQRCDLPALIRGLNYLDVTTDEAFEKSYPRLRGLLKRWASHDIKRRESEIESLLQSKDQERAMKRLLDFMKDFAPRRQDVNRVVAISASLGELTDRWNASLSDITKVRMDLLVEALNIKDSVIDQLAHYGAS